MKLYSEAELNGLTTAQITNISNVLAKSLKIKETKRFATKPKAIKKALELQAKIKSLKPKQSDKPKKSTKVDKPKKILISAEKPEPSLSVYTKLWEICDDELDGIERKKLAKIYASKTEILESSIQWYISQAISRGYLEYNLD